MTEGYGVAPNKAYPKLLEAKLQTKHPGLKVINGAVSGSISSSLADRLKFFIKRVKPTHVVIAIGGNDARQGLSTTEISKNIQAAIDLAKKNQLIPILAGFRIFTNLGSEYTEKFAALYSELAKKNHLTFIPFLLAGVGGVAELNQRDGFHPNEAGHVKIAQTVYEILEPTLK